MSRYKRITLYYNMEDSQDGLRYALINSLSARKKSLFDKMLDNYLETYGISNIEDLTLKDLQEMSKMLMGKEEVKEKRGRGRPRKVVEAIIKEEPKFEKEVAGPKEEVREKSFTEVKPETKLKTEKEEDKEVLIEEKKEKVIIQQPNKANKNPMSFNIEDDDDDDEGGIDPALLGELDAFNL